MNTISMDDILKASLGEPLSSLRVSFKKTVQIRDYESEVIECTTELNLEEPLTGIERTFVISLIQAQLEYEAYINMQTKGRITVEEFNIRRQGLLDSVNLIGKKAESLGIDISKWVKDYSIK